MNKNEAPVSHRVLANGLEHHLLEWTPEGRSRDGTSRDPPERGQHLGAVAVLLHGYMDAAGTWDLVAPLLARAGLRVLAPDMRGFGEGPRAPVGGYYHFADYVADVAQLLDAAVAKDEVIYLVGHSMGGTVSTLVSGAFPERFAKVALLEGLGPPDHPFEVAPDRMRRWIDEVRTMSSRTPRKTIGTREDALRRLTMNHPNVPRAVLETRLPHLVRAVPDTDDQVAWRFDPLHKTTSPTSFYAQTFMAFARRVRCPVLYVSGGEAGFHPPDEAARLAAFASHDHETLEGAGHMMHWTQPNELASLLLAFFGAPSF